MVELADTGTPTLTGGRIKRLAAYLGNEAFMLTWGDGVSDVNLHDLLAFHRSHGKLVALTAVRPPAHYGHLELDGLPAMNIDKGMSIVSVSLQMPESR